MLETSWNLDVQMCAMIFPEARFQKNLFILYILPHELSNTHTWSHVLPFNFPSGSKPLSPCSASPPNVKLGRDTIVEHAQLVPSLTQGAKSHPQSSPTRNRKLWELMRHVLNLKGYCVVSAVWLVLSRSLGCFTLADAWLQFVLTC